MAARLKKGDKVIVLTGKDKGKTGDITLVDPKKNKAIVSGINMIVRHTKQTQNNAGGKLRKEAFIEISNLAYLEPKDGKPTRIGFKFVDGKEVRYAKRSGEVVNG